MTAMPTNTPKIGESVAQSWAASIWSRGKGLQLKEMRKTSWTPGRSWERKLRATLTLADLGFITSATVLASAAFPHPSAGYACTVVVLLWLLGLSAYRSRDPRFAASASEESKRVIAASVMTFGAVSLLAEVPLNGVEHGFFVLAYALGMGGVLSGRLMVRAWLNRQRITGRCLSRVMVLGERSDVEHMVGKIRTKSASPYLVVGAALISGQAGGTEMVDGQQVPVIADLKSLAPLLHAVEADAVMVAGPVPGGNEFIRDLAWSLERTGVNLVLANGITSVTANRIKACPAAGIPLFHVDLPRYRGCKHALKRSVDVVLSSCALVLLLPVFAALAALIVRDSPGPAIFKQERVGQGERKFTMYKFRSMVETAELELIGLAGKNEGAGLLFKMRNDPRVTGVGHWLRRLSLDELPQLWNVLKGDMSLVGPRPPLPSEVAEYDEALHRRLYVKPGLTGLWQVNGRSDLSWKESIRLDLYYVENWSLAGDLLIMFQTIKVLLKPHGAY